MGEPDNVFPENGLTFVNLTVRLGTNMIGPDRVLHRFYNGASVGPVIRTQAGGELIIHLENKLPVEPIDIDPPRNMTPGPLADPRDSEESSKRREASMLIRRFRFAE